MKMLLIFILILSCSEEKKGRFIEKGRSTEVRQFLQKNIEGNLDLFVAFFWPKTIEKKESPIVQNIIEDSLKISSKKNNYFKKKLAIKCRYERASCDCVLEDLCDEGEIPDTNNISSCENMRDHLDEIEMDIIEIAILIDSLKNRLNNFKVKGEWLETHLDHPDSLFLPYINLQNQNISIPILGNKKISYSTERGEIFDFNYTDPTINFSFYEKIIKNQKVQFSGNIVDAKIDVLNKEYVYQFMGEMTKNENGVLRRGILYFELPKPERDCTN